MTAARGEAAAGRGGGGGWKSLRWRWAWPFASAGGAVALRAPSSPAARAAPFLDVSPARALGGPGRGGHAPRAEVCMWALGGVVSSFPVPPDPKEQAAGSEREGVGDRGVLFLLPLAFEGKQSRALQPRDLSLNPHPTLNPSQDWRGRLPHVFPGLEPGRLCFPWPGWGQIMEPFPSPSSTSF